MLVLADADDDDDDEVLIIGNIDTINFDDVDVDAGEKMEVTTESRNRAERKTMITYSDSRRGSSSTPSRRPTAATIST